MPAAPAIYPASIAVLPFVNNSPDPENEYFSDGVSEEIINALAKVRGLKVIARTSSFAYKNKAIDVRDIGQQLQVANILEGSVRRAGRKVRIAAQLVSARDGVQLWARRFDRELKDIFELQDEISLLIADQIRAQYGHFELQDQLVRPPTKNIEAYDLYLKARYNHLRWDNPGITNAIAFYKECTLMAPNFALPYFGLAYCFAMRASFGGFHELLEVAQGYLEKGFSIDENAGPGHFSKATLAFWGRWSFAEGQAAYRQALAVNPGDTEAEEGLAELYTAVGDFEQALRHARHILSTNPLSANHHYTLANIHYLSGDYQEALACAATAMEVKPGFTHAVGLTQLCYILLGDWQGLERFLAQAECPEQPEACRAVYQLFHGQRLEGEVPAVQPSAQVDLFTWELYLKLYLGEEEEAMDLLEEKVGQRIGQYINFQNMPLLKPLHAHARFRALVEKVFPQGLLSKEPEPAARPRAALMEEAEWQPVLLQLKAVMKKDQLYQDASLSLRSLAERLGITANKLSWLLNEQLGQNFNEYVNTLRLQLFQELALKPGNAHLTLLGLAYESGFNSKTVFNEFFKKSVGLTPRAWVKKQQQE